MHSWFGKHHPSFTVNMEMIQSPAYLNLRNMPIDLKTLYSKLITNKQILSWMSQPNENHFDAFVAVHSASVTLYNMDLQHNNPILHDYIEEYTGSVVDFETIGERYA